MSQSNPGDAGSKAGWWSALRRPAAKWSLLSLLLVGVTSGILFWGAFNTGMEATNTLEFCIGCHEMRDNVYAEYKETIHYSNRTGVRRRLKRGSSRRRSLRRNAWSWPNENGRA